ncbi:MAG TPA: PaaX family transcriptional regulator C-terminal domain-containing protein [Flexivirga sp.]|uniref:PaaX family transcriptional regulator n=1 Tax=Flexivirga sp. TaxID=1962927 RepID=UPI002BA84355|nr:PaaX family transcriptional regulator C-terminal domain-containing protein [Flexivirga sp.]HWC24591.1 PaaX family transcriptional regulator C-terminal domain-containing protein [Flexivirga sp.]
MQRTKVQRQQLIVTLYGLYGEFWGGSLPVSTLVSMLGRLGVEGPAARSTISRLKSKSVLLSDTSSGSTRYMLSEDALGIFRADDKRIFAPERSTPDDPWAVVIFSVPEAERARRYELRTELISLGFGFVAAGVAIAPSTVLPQAIARLEQRSLGHYVEYFSGQYLKAGDIRARVAEWWDLELLERQYSEFLADYSGLATSCRRGSLKMGPEEAFGSYIQMLTRWREFPYRDPNLPLEYLPDDWKAPAAKKVFLTLHESLAQLSEAFVRELLVGNRRSEPASALSSTDR